jgi:hypothetical protein
MYRRMSHKHPWTTPTEGNTVAVQVAPTAAAIAVKMVPARIVAHLPLTQNGMTAVGAGIGLTGQIQMLNQTR